jgi:hypothetical protein
MLIDCLMAKNAADRPANAQGIWNGLDMLAEKSSNLPKTKLV